MCTEIMLSFDCEILNKHQTKKHQFCRDLDLLVTLIGIQVSYVNRQIVDAGLLVIAQFKSTFRTHKFFGV